MTTIVTRVGKGSPLTTAEVDANFTNLNNDKAEVNSPTLTGTPLAPTAAVGTNTTQIATTEFVISQASTSNPVMNGAVAIGSSTRFARADHVHPIDTSRAPVNSPTFTGTVTIPSGASIAGFAPLASPNFTGTVTGITKAMVGLGSADNTSDLAKPISTATQSALDLKANIANPTLTGTTTISVLNCQNQATIGGYIELGSMTGTSTPFVDFHSSGTGNDYDGRIIVSGGSGTVGQGAMSFMGASATFNMPITSTGDITAFSDERLKRDIVQITGALERVLSWKGVTFTRRNDGSKSRGVLAQDIQKNAPELVLENRSGFLSVNYAQMAGDFIEAFRDLKNELDAVKAELAALKG